MSARVLRVRHILYGTGWWQRLLAERGHALVRFDADHGVERRVLVEDLSPEQAHAWANCPGCIAPAWCVKHQQCAAEYEPPLRGESLRESAARTDAAVADMMGRDPRAVVVALRGVS